jgi:hypothetical protein
VAPAVLCSGFYFLFFRFSFSETAFLLEISLRGFPGHFSARESGSKGVSAP